MSSPFTSDQIRQVCEFTFVSDKDAMILLKKNHGDVQRAVEAYFNDPDGSVKEDVTSTGWDPAMDNIPSFRIDADDTSTGALPSMSRPNSRVDNHKTVLDLSPEYAQAAASVQQNWPQDWDDDEMSRAIELSKQQDTPPQENGVTVTGNQVGPQFSRATRDHYPDAQWAMTAPVLSSRELIDHPPPAKRRRIEGQPAFLRGSKETGYLGPLLTIYHAIPLAREALLLPPMKVLSYRLDPKWWAGQSDENRKALALEVDQHVDRNKLNLLAEIQCLMAFLDGTKRAYGSVDALADLQGLKTFHAVTRFSQLLEAWRDAAMSQCGPEQLTQVFSSTAVKSDGSENVSRDMVCVEVPVNRNPDETITDLLDRNVWNDDPVNHLDDIWFQHCGEIFTIRMTDPGNRDNGLNVITSPIWYSDRYLEDRRTAIREIRKQVQDIRKEMTQYTNLQKRCEFVVGPDRKTIKVREVLRAASEAYATAMTDRFPDHRVAGDLAENERHTAGSDIQSVVERIDRKLQMLEEVKSKLASKTRDISRQMTEPSDDPEHSPVHKYWLMGVATLPDVTYLRRRNADLLGLGELNGTERAEWQWWRTSWSDQGDPSPAPAPVWGPITQDQAEAAKKQSNGATPDPYAVVEVSEEDVIQAVRSEGNSVVMVYANENAINFEPTLPSEALRKFVLQDNSEFANELKEDTQSAETPQESETLFEDVALEDSPNGHRLARDMAPMSIGSPHRDEDGQPSPKRPKSSDEAWKLGRDEGLPSYEDSTQPEMQERGYHKIGQYAEQMLKKYGQGRNNEDGKADVLHLEHSMDLPR